MSTTDGPVANGSSLPATDSGTGTSNGNNGKSSGLPELPHVTNNIIPLANVLRFYTQEAYKQLSRMIENLAHTRTSESDVARKRKFLMLIVSLRQDFIKIYTLVKWAQKSKDVSKLIDLLNWFRTQDFYFDNLGLGLSELNHFSGAKLPNSDILTALEVLVKGRPQLPSYHYLEKPPISPEKILEVMRDLNLALTARMALLSSIPRRFNNNYEVKDGRVVITIPNEFQVSITVANDMIIDESEYYKSPFFFIDFAFLFGINPDTSLITHRGSKVITTLPKSSRAKLEANVNQVLLASSLEGLYDFLHKYAIIYKLYLISRQLRDLSIHSKWRGNIQYKYTSSLIVINYWTGHYLSRNWKSFIEVGIDRDYNLHCRWFKNGKYEELSGLPDINTTSDTEEAQDLSVDFIMSSIINKHSEIIMDRIHSRYVETVSSDAVSIINPHQLLLKLGPKQSTVFAINPLTGFFYFMNPSPIEMTYQSKINALPSSLKNKPFISETDLVQNVVTNLIQLKLDTFSRSLKTKLIAAEWIANDTVKINEYETTKLFNFIVDERANSFNKIKFYRARDWPSSWFLINMISGLTANTYWWVARLKSVKGEWKIQWLQQLQTEEGELDYKFFKTLFHSCSKSIMNHLLVEDLQGRGIGYHKIDDPKVLEKLNFPHEELLEGGTVVALHNSGKLLPISISSSTLFLVITFICEGNSKRLQLSLHGSLKNQTEADAGSLKKLNVIVLPEKEQFKITSSIDVSEKVDDTEATSHTTALLNQTFETVSRMNSLIKISDQIRKTNIQMRSGEENEFVFDIDPFYKPFRLSINESGSNVLKLEADPEENSYVKLLIGFVNQEINSSDAALLGSFRYLKLVVPIFESIKSVQTTLKTSQIPELPNGLPRLQFELKFQNLNLMHFFFVINSVNPGSPKKIQRDHLSFSVSLKRSKHGNAGAMLYKFSMKDNFNSQNLKFKKLFELIFRSFNGLYKDALAQKSTFVKLNYDFVIEGKLLLPLMNALAGAFVEYLGSPQ